jgi:RNA polymerase sigma-B factor
VKLAVAERERIINTYRYLCARGARKFMRDGIDRCDLEQVAAIGLIKATDRFDPELGTPFEAYAWTLVLGELMHYVRDSERLLRVPRRVRELDRRCSEAERALWNELGRNATNAELAERVGIEEDELTEIRKFREERVPLSVDALRPFEEAQLSYTIDRQLDRMMLESGLQRLTPLEREIVRQIYEHDIPVGELARRLGYSRRHITRLHSAALKKLSARPRGRTA